MSTDLLKYTQKVRGFQHRNFEFLEEKLIWSIRRKTFQCPRCGNHKVLVQASRTRQVQGLSSGNRLTFFQFISHRIYCYACHHRSQETFPFLTSPKSRITKALEYQIIEDRQEMSIRAVAAKYQLRWELVKEVERKFLTKKYAHVSATQVKRIGIDEIHVGSTDQGGYRFLTVVRDLDNGTVIHVEKGKGIIALEGLEKKLRAKKLKVVAMDMSNAYSSWVEQYFPRARIVFDHFHVIKLMNERLDRLRRRYIAELDETQRQQFKKLRSVFLRNQENQSKDGLVILKNMRTHFSDLADAYMLKEALRSIYKTAKNALDARWAFLRWAKIAEETGQRELVAMAKTIREKIRGIITF